jgi:hypothetical protein
VTEAEAAKSSDSQSWDSFWAEVQQTERTEAICGVTVKVPTDITLRFDRRVEDLQASGREEDVEELVADLFGADVYQAWVTNGMTGRQFRTVLGWGMANAKGKPLTFREAYDLMKAAEDGPGNGQAPTGANRAQRRQSAPTGGPSKRTSGGSTRSGRKR